MKNDIESAPVNPEKMEKEARIVLHFLRHGEKESGVEGADAGARLTSTGRIQSREIAIERENVTKNSLPVGKQSLAYGSPRIRARETAGWAMAGNAYDLLSGDETFYELLATIDAEVEPSKDKRFGSKIRTDRRLDFKMDRSTELGNMEEDEYGKKRLLKFVVEDSDRIAKELGDKETSTYSKMASGIAEIIEKYAKVADRWHELVNDEKKEYEETMDRFLGTHQSVPESFLAKLIEKTKGVAERDKLVSVLNNQGFGFAEGFDVEVIKRTKDEKPSIRVKYEKTQRKKDEGEIMPREEVVYTFDEVVPIEIIEEIIKEGKE